MSKTGGAGTNSASLQVINRGTVSAQSGALYFWHLTNMDGAFALSHGSRLEVRDPLLLGSGALTGSGTLAAPSITSAGLVSPGAPDAVLTIAGDYTQQLGGIRQFDLAGTAPGTNQSQVQVTGAARLDNLVALRFHDPYSPAVGSSHIVLTAAALDGQARGYDHALFLGQNKRMIPVYNPTSLTLTAVSAPDPARPTLVAGFQPEPPLALVWWASEFVGFDLYFKTNLLSPSWTLCPGVTNRLLENP